MTPGYAPDLMSYLFGNILTVTKTEILLMLALSVLIILCFIFFYRIILYVAFNEEYAKTSGLPVSFINYLMMVLIALTVVLNIRVVGIILILSLLTLPQATANILTNDFKSMIFLSVLFALIGSLSGLLMSYYANIPSGASIIFILVIIFGIMKLYSVLSDRYRHAKNLRHK